MKIRKQVFTCLFLMTGMLFVTAAIAFPQDEGKTSSQERDAGFSVSASYIHQFDTDIGRSGEFRLDRVLARADGKR